MEEFPVIPTEFVRDTMEGSDLGDARLDRRNGRIAEMIAESPRQEFPQAALDEAETEATYRFWRHPDTGFEPVIRPHLEETASRLDQREGPVLAVHDSTAFDFGEDFRPGLGRVKGTGNFGFYGHFTLAVRATGSKLPEGLLSGQLWRREIPPEVDEQKRQPSKDCLSTKQDEGTKWLEGIEEAEKRLEATDLVHVMDRGADAYPRLVHLVESERLRFVTRANQNRCICDDIDGVESPKLEDALREAPRRAEKTIELSSRCHGDSPPSAEKKHPSREAREARVEIRAREVEVARPHDADRQLSESIKLGVVWVREPNPPEGAEPVDWRIYTGEPIEGTEQVERIVDWYDRRWVIEQYNGVLKGGCRIEERRLESAETLTTALGMMAVAAWRLLALRTLAQNRPETPAPRWLRTSQLKVLAANSKTRLDTAEGTTVGEALQAIASMGGYLRQNGKPGWLVITRGYHRLRLKELAWRKAHFEGRQTERQSLLDTIRDLTDQADDIDELVSQLDELPVEPDEDL